MKLALGFIACVLALIAQFWPTPLKPMPFPESRPLLLVCCGTYFAISFGLQAITTMYEKDAILFTLEPNSKSPWFATMGGHRVKVSTTLPRFSVKSPYPTPHDPAVSNGILAAVRIYAESSGDER